MINLPLISIPMEMGGLLFLTDLDALILMYKFFNSAINGFFPLEIEIKIKMYLDIKCTLRRNAKNSHYQYYSSPSERK